ncbi:hypothetical protein M3Y95_00077900 [Aphelenchoides besseyi]|nr:hypothetical protein M3Y95_00077900 [Aphelenchoides besseyi]
MVGQCDLPKCQSCDDLSCGNLHDELNEIKKLCAKHELLYRTFSSWKHAVRKNECQLEILNDTANILQARREMLVQTLALKKDDPVLLKRLQRDIRAVESQVNCWMRDLAEISGDRTKLDIELIKLRCKLQRSMTNIEIAHIDFEFIEAQHREIWDQFLSEIPSSKSNIRPKPTESKQ